MADESTTVRKTPARKAPADAPKRRGRPVGSGGLTGPKASKTGIVLKIPLAELLKLDSPAIRALIKRYL
jgi:hypothetical protein